MELCVVCDKPVRTNQSHWLIRLDVTGAPVAIDEEIEESKDLGFHVVGPECRRRHPEACLRSSELDNAETSC